MKKERKIVYLVLMAIAILGMFLPIARFKDNAAGAMANDIAKQEEKVKSAETKLERWEKGGTKTEEEINKQKKQVQKEKDKLTALLEKQEEASKEEAGGISYSLLPGTLPVNDIAVRYGDQETAVENAKTKKKTLEDELAALKKECEDQQAALEAETAKLETMQGEEEVAAQQKLIKTTQSELEKKEKSIQKKESAIASQEKAIESAQAKLEKLKAEKDALKADELQIDKEKINQYKLYQTNKGQYTFCEWAAFIMLVLAVAFMLLAGDKDVSVFYTISSFCHLIGILLSAFVILRLAAFPIKLPYTNASILWPVALMILGGSIGAFAAHVQVIHNSKRSMIYVFCTFLSLLAIVPFWLMIVNATRSSQAIQQGVSIVPGSYLGYNWKVLDSKNFDVSVGFMNSAIIAFSSTILSVFFSAMTAYGFKVYQFKGNKFLYAVVMAIIMIPGQVTGTGFFMFMYQMHWVNNRLALIIPGIAAASTVFFFRQYLEANLQLSLVEAARIDGCGEFRTFCRIILPIMLPAMATMGIMAVITAWNNYLTPLMLFTDPGLKTLPMMVQELRGDIYRTEFGSIYLGLTMTALPLIIVYFALSKYIIAGVALGGVKE